MAVPVVLQYVAAAAAVYGAVNQYQARKEQKKQNRISNKIESRKRVDNIRAAIARGRLQRAEQEAAGFGFGVAGGTAVAGGVAGTQGSVNAAIASSNRQFTGQQALAAGSNRIAGFLGNAQLAGDIGGIAGQFIGQQGQQNWESLTGIFG